MFSDYCYDSLILKVREWFYLDVFISETSWYDKHRPMFQVSFFLHQAF